MSAFTSKLPRPTSARRPSNPNEGSTSRLYSNIPVSVRKANLFTPQPKRSLQNGTFSSTARKSSMTTDKKYQRPLKPIPDRDEQHRMFESLVDFLRINEPTFPLPDERKFFMSVGTTETARIFEFLLSRLYGPEFKINKLEIDVPEALATIGYPYIRTVTKSALVSITTRQAIANLLVIFDWLVEQIKSANNGEALLEIGSDSAKVFKSVLKHPEHSSDENRRGDQASSLEAASSELERLKEEYTHLALSVQELDEIQLERQALAEDSNKCEEYKDQMEKYLAIKTEEADTIEKDCRMLGVELEEKKTALEFLLLEIQEQPKYDLSSVARTREKIKSIERDMENDKRKGETEIAHISTLLAKEKHDLARTKERVALEEARLNKVIAAESSSLKHDKDNYVKNGQLHLELVKKTLEGNRQEIVAAVNKEELELKYFTEVKQEMEKENKLVKTASKRMQYLINTVK